MRKQLATPKQKEVVLPENPRPAQYNDAAYRDESLVNAKGQAEELASMIEKQRTVMKKYKLELEQKTIKKYQLYSTSSNAWKDFNLSLPNKRKLEVKKG